MLRRCSVLNYSVYTAIIVVNGGFSFHPQAIQFIFIQQSMPGNRSSSLINQQRFLRTVYHDRIRLLNYVPGLLRTAAVNRSSTESYRFPRVCYQGSEKGQSFTLLFKCCCNMLVECDCLLMSVHLLCTAITPSEKAAVILQPASAPALRNKMF